MRQAQNRGWNRLWKSKPAKLYWLCLIWALAVAAASQQQLLILVRQELAALNLLFELRGTQPPAPEIVLLAIDQRSMGADIFDQETTDRSPQLESLRSYPFPRSIYADALDRLFAAGAKVVAIDLLFLSPQNPVHDERLRTAIERRRDRVVIGSNFTDDGLQLMEPSVILPEGLDPGSVVGYVNYWLDPDGFVRRAKHRTYASSAAGVAPSPNEPLLPSFDALAASRFAPDLSLPAPDKNVFINFVGPPGSFPSHPFYMLFYEKAWKENLHNGEVFRDKIVLIGPGGNFQHDSRLTPFGHGAFGETPGVEIHAAAIGTLLHGTAPRALAEWIGLVTVFLLALATAALLNLNCHPVAKVLLLAGLCAGYFGLALALFAEWRLIPWVAAPLWTVAGGGLIGIVVQLIAERLEKMRVRHTLEKYVSRPVADAILKRSGEYEQSLGGERKRVTILFSDIRGFTPFSEKLNPHELVEVLNEYLTAMVEVVMTHDGTLDKFIGDAIMALYGAPMSHGESEDAWRAVQTAYGMRVRLDQLQRDWQKQGRPPLRIGIGINHGEVIVGNIGSPQRMEYTVIGDAVNVASRVEGLNKDHGTDILLTDSVYELVKDRVQARLIGAASVKGRQQQVNLYALDSIGTASPTSKSPVPPPPLQIVPRMD